MGSVLRSLIRPQRAIMVLVVTVLAALSLINAQPPVYGQSANLALNKPATASSVETASLTANLAVDGNAGTRWSSAWSDPQWIRIDLNATYTINRVVLRWEAAYARGYRVEISVDGTNWTQIYATAAGDGGTDDLTGLSGTGRFLRIYGTARATQWGYSLWEIEAYGSGSTPTSTPTPPSGGTNVAAGKPVSGSTTLSNPGRVTDGDKNTANFAGIDLGPRWIQIDLGQSYSLNRVRLWHYFGDGRHAKPHHPGSSPFSVQPEMSSSWWIWESLFS
jgi:hypothetical protein